MFFSPFRRATSLAIRFLDFCSTISEFASFLHVSSTVVSQLDPVITLARYLYYLAVYRAFGFSAAFHRERWTRMLPLGAFPLRVFFSARDARNANLLNKFADTLPCARSVPRRYIKLLYLIERSRVSHRAFRKTLFATMYFVRPLSRSTVRIFAYSL